MKIDDGMQVSLRLLIIVMTGVVIVTSVNIAFAEVQFNNAILAPFKDSYIVLVGNVTEVKNMTSENGTGYSVAVEKYWKNPQPFDLLTVVGYGTRKEITDPTQENYFNQAVFEKNNRVFLYLNQKNGEYVISPFSFIISNSPPGSTVTLRPDKNNYYGSENVSILGVINKGYMYASEAEYGKNSTVSILVSNPNKEKYLIDQVDVKPDGSFIYQFKIKGKLGISGTYESDIDVSGGGHGITFDYVTDPLNQFKSGIAAENIKCNTGFERVLKSEDNSPACVKPETSKILVERGWGSIPSHKISSSTVGLRITRLNMPSLNLKDMHVVTVSNDLLTRFPELLNYTQEADAHYEKVNTLCLTAPSNDYCGVSGPTSLDLPYNATMNQERADQLIAGLGLNLTSDTETTQDTDNAVISMNGHYYRIVIIGNQ